MLGRKKREIGGASTLTQRAMVTGVAHGLHVPPLSPRAFQDMAAGASMPLQTPHSPLSGTSSMLDLGALRASGTGEAPMGLRTALSNPETSLSGSQVPNVRIETSASAGVISLVSGSNMASSSGPAPSGGSGDAQPPSAPAAQAAASQPAPHAVPPDSSAELASGLSSGPGGATQGPPAGGGAGALASTASVGEPPQVSAGPRIPFLSPEPAGMLPFRPGGLLYMQEDPAGKPLGDHMCYGYRVSSAGYGPDDPDLVHMADIFLNGSDGEGDDSPPKPAPVTVATSGAPQAAAPSDNNLRPGPTGAQPPTSYPVPTAGSAVIPVAPGMVAPQQTTEAALGAGQEAPRPPASEVREPTGEVRREPEGSTAAAAKPDGRVEDDAGKDGGMRGPGGDGGDPASGGAKERTTLQTKDEALIIASAVHAANGSA